jgi:hypothetical protein
MTAPELNRSEINRSLWVLFDYALVDPRGGDVTFRWRHGATSRVMVRWAEED